jgi:hypothetical protein
MLIVIDRLAVSQATGSAEAAQGDPDWYPSMLPVAAYTGFSYRASGPGIIQLQDA